MATFNIQINEIVKEIVGQNVSVGQVVYLSGNGKWYLASATTPETSTTELRIVLANALADEQVDTLVMGYYEFTDGTILTPGSKYRLSSEFGAITPQVYVSSNFTVRYVGTAFDSKTILFNPDPTYITENGRKINDVDILSAIPGIDLSSYVTVGTNQEITGIKTFTKVVKGVTPVSPEDLVTLDYFDNNQTGGTGSSINKFKVINADYSTANNDLDTDYTIIARIGSTEFNLSSTGLAIGFRIQLFNDLGLDIALSSTDTVKGGLPATLPNGYFAYFTMETPGVWLVAVAGPAGTGLGNITGAITNNQIAVGTATDDDIEGTSGLTYDGSTLAVTGNVSATNISGTNTGDQDLSNLVDLTTDQNINGDKDFIGALYASGQADEAWDANLVATLGYLYENYQSITEGGYAGETLSSGDICYQGAGDKWFKASATNLDQVSGRLRRVSGGGPVDTWLAFTGSWSDTGTFTAGDLWYLSGTPGQMTTTIPATGYARVLGTSTSTTNRFSHTEAINYVAINGSNVNGVGLSGTDYIAWSDTENNGKYSITVDDNPYLHSYWGNSQASANPWYRNTFLGEDAGNFTVGDGESSGFLGGINTGIGAWALNSLTTGMQNVAVGNEALALLTDSGQNVAIGDGAMYYSVTGVSDNMGIGKNVLQNLTSGSYNVAMGRNSGYFIGSGSSTFTSGDEHTLLGGDTRPSANSTENEIVIGYSAIGNGSNTAVIGSSAITKISAGADYVATANEDLITKGYFDANSSGGTNINKFKVVTSDYSTANNNADTDHTVIARPSCSRVTISGAGLSVGFRIQVFNDTGGALSLTSLDTIKGALPSTLSNGNYAYFTMETPGVWLASVASDPAGGGGGDVYLANDNIFTGSNEFKNTATFFGNTGINEGITVNILDGLGMPRALMGAGNQGFSITGNPGVTITTLSTQLSYQGLDPTDDTGIGDRGYNDGRYLMDSPSDGGTYGRKDGAWAIVPEAADLSNYVTLNGTQTITGDKTFSSLKENTLLQSLGSPLVFVCPNKRS